jgi:hypothetical protein
MGPFLGSLVIVGLPTLWVAFDASGRDWHRVLFADRAWKWVVGCLLLFPVAFPAYFVHRGRAPRKGSGGLGPAKATFSAHAHGSAVSGAAAVERAVFELAATGQPPLARGSARTSYATTLKPPLLVSSPAGLEQRTIEGSMGLALLAGAAVAFAGGLIWAAVVIETRWNIGFLAGLIGAATGSVAFRVSGAPVRGVARLSIGLLAAGGIVVGKYVIFVHDVKNVAGSLAQQGLPASPDSIGYLDTRVMSTFVHHFGTVVRPVYGLWIGIAFFAALITSQGRRRAVRRL